MATIESQTKCPLESNIRLKSCLIIGVFYDLSVAVKYDAAVDQPAAVCCSMSILHHLKDGGGMVLMLRLLTGPPDIAQ